MGQVQDSDVSVDYTVIAAEYRRQVLQDEIPACKWVKLSCQRQENDLKRAAVLKIASPDGTDPDFPWVFSIGRANDICAWMECMPHVKGRWETDDIVLQPWQCFILTTLFGWIHKDTGFRRFRRGYIEVPRKNSKALALNTPIPTPSGWTVMGKIRIGDLVFDENHQVRSVTHVSEIFYGHECYKICFTNGETVVADAGHQWKIAGHADPITTEDLYQFQLAKKRPKHPKLDHADGVWILYVQACESVPTRCISVDSPSHLFLFGRSMLPTHNSTMSAGVGLYLLCADGEPGSEIYSTAVTRDQAKICWGMAHQMLLKLPDLCAEMGIVPLTNSISIPEAGAVFKPLSRESKTNEGLSPHGVIVDELHAHKTREIFDVVNQATGARRQPMILAITTAGDDRTGVCYEQHDYVESILLGRLKDESYFGIIYSIDIEDGDDWTLESSHRKANPNYGISVGADDMAGLCRQAMASAEAQNTFLTKRLNVWVSVGTAYFNMLAWDNLCAKPNLKLEDFLGKPCILALDLASTTDIAAKIYLFNAPSPGPQPKGSKGQRYQLFGRYYLPESAIEPGKPSYDRYSGWAKDGLLKLTPGNVIDFEFIEQDLIEDRDRFDVREVCYDPWQALELATKMVKEGLPMVKVPPTVQNFSEPMKLLKGLILDGAIEHNGDPILAWMMGNVHAHEDHKENVYPRKPRPQSKIDGAVGSIMAIGRSMILPFEDPGAIEVW